MRQGFTGVKYVNSESEVLIQTLALPLTVRLGNNFTSEHQYNHFRSTGNNNDYYYLTNVY